MEVTVHTMRTLLLALMILGAALPTPAADETDATRLLALHRIVLEAHLKSDVELLLRDEADDYVVVSQGEITRPTRDERRKKLGSYLGSTRFEIYRDGVPPIVRVSDDGTLGWVIVQVIARGLQTYPGGQKPVTFTSGWIELYEKHDGRWLRSGNVSNFEP